MKQSSVNAARWFGLIMIVLISAWDIDAMRPHIAAHSWDTLAFVSLFPIVHVSNYLTVGQLVNRMSPLLFENTSSVTSSTALPAGQDNSDLSGILPGGRDSRHRWRRFFPPQQVPPSLLSGPSDAKLYTFTAATTTAAQVSGSPHPVTRRHFTLESE